MLTFSNLSILSTNSRSTPSFPFYGATHFSHPRNHATFRTYGEPSASLRNLHAPITPREPTALMGNQLNLWRTYSTQHSLGIYCTSGNLRYPDSIHHLLYCTLETFGNSRIFSLSSPASPERWKIRNNSLEQISELKGGTARSCVHVMTLYCSSVEMCIQYSYSTDIYLQTEIELPALVVQMAAWTSNLVCSSEETL